MSLIDVLDAVGLVVPDERVAVAAIRDGQIRAEVFDDIDKAEQFLRQYPSMNHYFTPSPIKPGVSGRPKAADVVAARRLLVDADPAPDEEIAKQVASAVYGWCAEKGVHAVLVDSGRGHQVLVGTAADLDRPRASMFFRTRFERPGAKLDHTHDAARLVRLPGSVNHKTGRTARIVSISDGRPMTNGDLPAVAVVASGAGGTWRNDDFVLTGVPEGKRDDAVFRYACRLRSSARVSKEEALVLVLNAARSCTPPFPEQAARDKVERAWRYPSGGEALEICLALPGKCIGDPGAPFEPAALDALRVVRDKDPGSWQRIRADLKNTRAFRITDLERRMDEGVEPPDPDEIARIAVEDGEMIGQYFRRTGQWVACDSGPFRAWLKGHKLDVDEVVRHLMTNSWELVHRPFQQEEFVEDRAWNKDAAQLAFSPAEGEHPTWTMVLQNVGRTLDLPAQAAGFESGADYLLCWLAAIVQFPFEPSAFLFFYGPQGGGKSTFHESVRMLFTKGCVDAGGSLVSQQGFNGEIARAVLCYVEEIDLSDARKTAYTRIKRWTTGKTISVHAKHETPHDLQNSTHWIHCAQDLGHCAVFPGDSRITVCRVEKAEAQVPKEELLQRLKAEGPQFTKTLLEKRVPEAKTRLRVGVLENDAKRRMLENARSALEAWLDANLDKALKMDDKTLVAQFMEDVGPREALKWDAMRVMRELPEEFRLKRTTAFFSNASSPGA